MSSVTDHHEVCFNRYSRAFKEILSKSHANEDETEVEVEQQDIILNQKRKREAANKNIKNVCW